MARLGITQQTFNFKMLTPIYKLTEGKIKDSNYWDDKKWSFAAENKQEDEICDVLKPMLYEFQKKAIFKKPELKKRLKSSVANSPLFDENYDFIKSQAFEDQNFDPDLKVSGKLWLRELFMQC
jgi:hypothetical protein